ncbi:uncharacterized protein (DUF302 family) [Halomonas campaniensis]|uniref:Uncharacterized protein (DUF302 family) n=1 Tax=Halomonas campaniensis TaxID=213554 RepID=A0A7W5K074_9GAMM|nr:DUF302 domain-containing protein [Halomonas campaniensis]MBB3329463.1 uncharacterized protein (DUF302 family) [Halomonas campaniensis]
MSKLPLLMTALLLTAGGLAQAGNHGIEQRESDDGIEAVDQRLRAALEERGMRLVTVVDHAGNAESVEMSLPPTRTFIFGNPNVGTPMMQCQGSLALDLPQKMVIRVDGEQTLVEWNSPHYLAERHALGDCELPLDRVAEALEGIAAEAAGD